MGNPRPVLHVTDARRALTLQRAQRLRRLQTHCEWRMWNELQARRLAGMKFRRQHPMGPFIIDFYCPALRLAIEIDGPIHESRRSEDAARQGFLERQGLSFLRFTTDEVEQRLETCVESIRTAVERLAPHPQTPSSAARRGGFSFGGAEGGLLVRRRGEGASRLVASSRSVSGRGFSTGKQGGPSDGALYKDAGPLGRP
jgi:very-short-patch-repair endonuclease